jgi:hypothetical protein
MVEQRSCGAEVTEAGASLVPSQISPFTARPHCRKRNAANHPSPSISRVLPCDQQAYILRLGPPFKSHPCPRITVPFPPPSSLRQPQVSARETSRPVTSASALLDFNISPTPQCACCARAWCLSKTASRSSTAPSLHLDFFFFATMSGSKVIPKVEHLREFNQAVAGQ